MNKPRKKTKKKHRRQVIVEYHFKDTSVKDIRAFMLHTIHPLPQYSWYECYRILIQTVIKTKKERIRSAVCYYKEAY